MLAWGYVSFAAVIFVLCFGGTIERGLEKISTFIVLWIAFGLVSLALYFGHSMMFELRASDNRVASQSAEQIIDGAAPVRKLNFSLE